MTKFKTMKRKLTEVNVNKQKQNKKHKQNKNHKPKQKYKYILPTKQNKTKPK